MDFYAYNAVPAIMNDWLHFSYTRSKPAAEHSYWLIITLLENRKKIYEKLLRLLETWPLRGGAYGILEIILKIDNMCLGPLCFLHLMVYKKYTTH